MGMIPTAGRPSGSIPTSSMADIAFLLLIFFLVTTVFPKDKGLNLVLPRGIAPVPASNVMHLMVGSAGPLEVRMGNDSRTRSVSADAVGAIWRQAVEANPNLIAAVETRPDAPYGRTMAVLDQLQGVHAQRIALKVLPDAPR